MRWTFMFGGLTVLIAAATYSWEARQSLVESRLAVLITPARYYLPYDRAIFKLHFQLPPSPEEIITMRCTKIYDQLKFKWIHQNQSMPLFNICQKKRQKPRRLKRLAGIVTLIVAVVATAITAATAVGLAVANRVDHDKLRHCVVKFEKLVEHNFKLVDNTVDETLDVSEAINTRLSKTHEITQRAFKCLE